MNEDELIDWLRRHRGTEAIGDDAALLRFDSPDVAVTVDTQTEGVHFFPGTDPGVVARRLLAVNRSDCAAVGAVATHAFCTLSLPTGFDGRRFLRPLLAACRHHGIHLAGGDLARGDRLSTTLTLIGRRRDGGRWLRRDGAQPGHRLWLGGSVGESALGFHLARAGGRLLAGRAVLAPLPLGAEAGAAPLGAADAKRLETTARRALRRHQAPRPQMDLSEHLATRTAEGACLDVSDGFARDLHRLCRASRVGARVDEEALLETGGLAADLGLAERAARERANLASALGLDPLRLALEGGEDYVLLFTLPPEIVALPFAVESRSQPRPVGCITAESGVVRLQSKRGTLRSVPPQGWDHLAGEV